MQPIKLCNLFKHDILANIKNNVSQLVFVNYLLLFFFGPNIFLYNIFLKNYNKSKNPMFLKISLIFNYF